MKPPGVPARRTTPIARSALPRGRTRIRQRSVKRERLYADERRPLVERLLATRRWCEACPTLARAGIMLARYERDPRPAVDVHEVKSRARLGSIVDEANCKTVCRRCHDWITTNDVHAVSLGLSMHSWD